MFQRPSVGSLSNRGLLATTKDCTNGTLKKKLTTSVWWWQFMSLIATIMQDTIRYQYYKIVIWYTNQLIFLSMHNKVHMYRLRV